MTKIYALLIVLPLLFSCAEISVKQREISSYSEEPENTYFSHNYIFPLDDYRYTSGFKWRRSHFHQGIDLVSKWGNLIKSIDDGVVVFAGRTKGYGNYIIIDHGNDIRSSYAHASKILVKKGETVTQGQEIAKVGATGRATCSHLHFEIHYQNRPVDPYAFLTEDQLIFKTPRTKRE